MTIKQLEDLLEVKEREVREMKLEIQKKKLKELTDSCPYTSGDVIMKDGNCFVITDFNIRSDNTLIIITRSLYSFNYKLHLSESIDRWIDCLGWLRIGRAKFDEDKLIEINLNYSKMGTDA